MKRAKYNTKQKEQLLKFFENNLGSLFTVKELVEKLTLNGTVVGISTVYRFLEDLLKDGLVKKYEEKNQTKYGYFSCNKYDHYHLKCDICGKVIHIDCKEITNMKSHIFMDHNFEIDVKNLFINGRCKLCK